MALPALPLKSALFPPANRGFRGKRWLAIALRTAHLVGTAGAGGGFLYGAAAEAWLPYLWLTLASGAVMTALEIWTNGVWLVQVRGAAVLLKLALLGYAAHAPAHAGIALVFVVAISGVVSHAPARVRYWSLLHGRRVDTLPAP